MIWSFTTIGSCVLVLALLTALLLALLIQQNRSAKQIGVWFLSGFAGILLGVAGSVAAVSLSDYELERHARATVELPSGNASASSMPSGPGGAAMGGPGGGMGGMMGGMGGPGGMMGGMGGGFGAPSNSRQLTMLVRKIELLTGDVALGLTAEQSAAIVKILDGVEKAEQLSDDDAKAKYESLLAVLDEKQKAKQEAIGLPRRPGGGPGGPGGAPGGPGGPGGGPGGPGGGPGAQPGNPFQTDENAAALKTLRERFGATPAETPPKT